MLAQALGSFSDWGLTVDTTVTRSSIEQIQGIIDGTWDVGITAEDNVVARDSQPGADLRMLAQLEPTTVLTLVARPEIDSLAALRGHTISIDAPSSGFVLVLQHMLAANGLQSGDYSLSVVGGSPLRLSDLLAGGADASLLNPPLDSQAIAAGFHALAQASEYIPDYPGVVVTATADWLASNGDRLTGYLAALLAATRWALLPRNRDQSLAILEASGLTAEAAANAYAGLNPDLPISLRGLQTVIDLRAEQGLLAPPLPAPAAFLDLSFLNDARKLVMEST